MYHFLIKLHSRSLIRKLWLRKHKYSKKYEGGRHGLDVFFLIFKIFLFVGFWSSSFDFFTCIKLFSSRAFFPDVKMNIMPSEFRLQKQILTCGSPKGRCKYLEAGRVKIDFLWCFEYRVISKLFEVFIACLLQNNLIRYLFYCRVYICMHVGMWWLFKLKQVAHCVPFCQFYTKFYRQNKTQWAILKQICI